MYTTNCQIIPFSSYICLLAICLRKNYIELTHFNSFERKILMIVFSLFPRVKTILHNQTFDRFRVFCHWLVNHSTFGNIILLCIMCSSALLAVESPISEPSPVITNTFTITKLIYILGVVYYVYFKWLNVPHLPRSSVFELMICQTFINTLRTSLKIALELSLKLIYVHEPIEIYRTQLNRNKVELFGFIVE